MMDVFATVVVVATFYFIVRGAEVRLALLAGGGLGRSMSPVAAATSVAGGYAGVTVFDIAKRTAVPALSAAVLVVIILGFLG